MAAEHVLIARLADGPLVRLPGAADFGEAHQRWGRLDRAARENRIVELRRVPGLANQAAAQPLAIAWLAVRQAGDVLPIGGVVAQLPERDLRGLRPEPLSLAAAEAAAGSPERRLYGSIVSDGQDFFLTED